MTNESLSDVTTGLAVINDSARTLTLESSHRIYLGDLRKPIEVQLWRDDETGFLSSWSSHQIWTPVSHGPYAPQPGGNNQDSQAALKSVVLGYKALFKQAIDEGHVPEDSWLVPEAK